MPRRILDMGIPEALAPRFRTVSTLNLSVALPTSPGCPTAAGSVGASRFSDTMVPDC